MTTLLIGLTATDCVLLRRMLAEVGRPISAVASHREALAEIRRTDVGLVICERDLPDGGWKDVLGAILTRPVPPSLIVTSRLADDRLWSEVLNLGGYDVLAQPFDGEEVMRIGGLARDQWLRAKDDRQRTAAGGRSAAA